MPDRRRMSCLALGPTSLVLCAALAACARPSDDARSAGQALAEPLDGDAVIAEAAAALGQTLGASARYALDRGIAKVAQLDVKPFPGAMCNSGDEELWYNGEDAALVRLGLVGLADVVALEAMGTESAAPAHVELLAYASGTDAEAQTALGVLRQTESPAMMMSAVRALARNPALSDGATRALLAAELDAYETKALRDASGALVSVDLTSAPDAASLLARLRASPVVSFRASAASLLDRWAPNAAPSDVDALLDDPRYEVRVAAGRLLWKGSDASAARQSALLAWMSGDAARRQVRATVLRERYGLSEDEAAGWAAEPDGFAETYGEALAQLVGGALETAPPDADIGVLLDAATKITGVTDLVETAARAAARSTALADADKQRVLLALLPAAWTMHESGSPEGFFAIWRALARGIVVAPASSDVVQPFHAYVNVGSADRASLEAAIASPDANARLAAVKTVAQSEDAFLAALFDLKLAPADGFARAGGDAWLAALDAGADPKSVAAAFVAMAKPTNGYPESTVEAWNASDVAYFQAAQRAIGALSGDDARAAIIAFAKVVSPRNVSTGGGAPGPGAIDASPYVAAILGGLGGLAGLPTQAQMDAWDEILVRPDGTMRAHLLFATPARGAVAAHVAGLVRPRMVVTASTCWQGHPDPATERPAIAIGLAPYAMGAPRAPIGAAAVTDARIAALESASAAGDELGTSATVDQVLAKRPSAKDAYFGAWPWSKPDRERWESGADALVTQLLAATDAQEIDKLVTALGYATDYASLAPAKLDAVEARLATSVTDARGRARYAFFLRAAHGAGYDELVSRFRASVSLRWDLADLARPRGEQAALEALLASVGSDFDVTGSSIALAAEVAPRAAIGEPLRHTLTELAADGVAFWSTWGLWSEGSLPLARAAGPSLDFVLEGAALRAQIASAPNDDLRQRTQLFGTVVRDPRVSPAAASRLAWITLSNGAFHAAGAGSALTDPPLAVTQAIDMVVALDARADVDGAEKAALGRALLYVLK